jgi:hypothetical protein
MEVEGRAANPYSLYTDPDADPGFAKSFGFGSGYQGGECRILKKKCNIVFDFCISFDYFNKLKRNNFCIALKLSFPI